MIIAIVGKSGSGKNTVVNELLKNDEFKQIITYTTRPMRDGEEDGVTYHYVTKERFNELNDHSFFVETTSYNVASGETWFYGTSLYDAKDDDKNIIILNPEGLKAIKEYCFNHNKHLVSFYIDVYEDKLLERLKVRGDNPEEVKRRIAADNIDFANIYNLTDYAINNTEIPPEETARIIKKIIN